MHLSLNEMFRATRAKQYHTHYVWSDNFLKLPHDCLASCGLHCRAFRPRCSVVCLAPTHNKPGFVPCRNNNTTHKLALEYKPSRFLGRRTTVQWIAARTTQSNLSGHAMDSARYEHQRQ